MDLHRIEKKLREAEFFLSHLQRREQNPVGNDEGLDFLLSAFLSATRVVDYRLRHEQRTPYENWRKGWDERMDYHERSLVKLIDDDRAFEVHESGSKRTEKHTPMAVRMKDGEIEGFVALATSRPGAIAKADFYCIDGDGKEERATNVCAKYIDLTREMLEAYRSAQP
jgi:hypothetical protein